jgi:hypothetical protein
MASNGAFLLARSHNRTVFSRRRGTCCGVPQPSVTRSFIARSSQSAFWQQAQVSQTPCKFPCESTRRSYHASLPALTMTTPSAATYQSLSDRFVIVSEIATGLSKGLIVMLSGLATFFMLDSVSNPSATTECQRQDKVNDQTVPSCMNKSEGLVLATSAVTMADPSYRSEAGLNSDGKEATAAIERSRSYEVDSSCIHAIDSLAATPLMNCSCVSLSLLLRFQLEP